MKDKLLAAVFGGLLIGFVGILRAIPGAGSYLACCGCLATITGGGETEELKIIVLMGMGVVIAILTIIIATIGGAIGVPLFERRKPEPNPYQAGYQQGGYGNPRP